MFLMPITVVTNFLYTWTLAHCLYKKISIPEVFYRYAYYMFAI